MTLRMTFCATLVASLLAVTALSQPGVAQSEGPTIASSDGVNLRGLDKLSGTSTDLPVSVGETVSYGRMEIALLACRYPAENPEAEAFAFLEITSEVNGERLFYGWMIASSPALNALDHARYDVWVMGCQ
ncbi:MAG: DUF2155 domain-containing protein [Pararhodobacter sp.]|nr:DUF2155 domain-containing protein [Pararhodobacter sp.]